MQTCEECGHEMQKPVAPIPSRFIPFLCVNPACPESGYDGPQNDDHLNFDGV